MVNTKWSWNAFPLHILASEGGEGGGAAATGGETEGVGAETIAEAERAAEATGAAGVTGTAGAVVEQHNDQKLEQQATHWHGKCNLLCKMKNTRRAVEGAEQAKGLRRADRPTATWCHRDRQTHRERAVQGEGEGCRQRQPQWEPHNARYYRGNNNGTTGGYKHNSIFI